MESRSRSRNPLHADTIRHPARSGRLDHLRPNFRPNRLVETFEQVGLAHDDTEEIADLLTTLDVVPRATPQH
jgi:hypothetical protein